MSGIRWFAAHESWLMWLMSGDSCVMTHESWLMSHDSWVLTHESWLMSHDSWVMTPESWFMSHDSWVMTHESWLSISCVFDRISLAARWLGFSRFDWDGRTDRWQTNRLTDGRTTYGWTDSLKCDDYIFHIHIVCLIYSGTTGGQASHTHTV